MLSLETDTPFASIPQDTANQSPLVEWTRVAIKRTQLFCVLKETRGGIHRACLLTCSQSTGMILFSSISQRERPLANGHILVAQHTCSTYEHSLRIICLFKHSKGHPVSNNSPMQNMPVNPKSPLPKVRHGSIGPSARGEAGGRQARVWASVQMLKKH